MKKYILALPFLVALAGCQDSRYTRIEYRADCEGLSKEVSAFTLSCIADANPKSDEEPEDWIRICKDMAEDMYCPKKKYKVTYFRPSGERAKVVHRVELKH